MSISLLYHGFGIKGYNYLRTLFEKGTIIFGINQKKRMLNAPSAVAGMSKGVVLCIVDSNRYPSEGNRFSLSYLFLVLSAKDVESFGKPKFNLRNREEATQKLLNGMHWSYRGI